MDSSIREERDFISLSELNYVSRAPDISALIKQQFLDFTVNEELGFPLSGDGEHLYLRIRKTDLSTTDVARRLASICRSSLSNIGYSGMKDKRGECTQWFSVPLTRINEQRLEEIAS